jgi:hypothetical protein
MLVAKQSVAFDPVFNAKAREMRIYIRGLSRPQCGLSICSSLLVPDTQEAISCGNS